MPITVQYQVSLKDYWEANKLFKKHNRKGRLYQLGDTAIILVGGYMVLSQNNPMLGFVFLTLGLCFLFNLIEKGIIALNYYRFFRKKHLEKLVFSSSSIVYTAPNIHSQISWEIFYSYIETPTIWVLLYTDRKRRYVVIPKNCLSEDAQKSLATLFKKQFSHEKRLADRDE